MFNSNSTAALDDYKIAAACAIVGNHYNQFSDAIYNNIRASFSILDSWLTRSAIVQVPRQGALPAFAQTHPADITIPLANGTTVSLTMNLGQHVTGSSVALSQTQYVHFVTPNPAPLESLINNYVFKFGKLLSFLTRTDVFLDQIMIPQTGAMPREVEWLCGTSGSSKAKRALHHQEGLVSYPEIAADLPALVTNWFNYYEDMEAILNLYFTAISKSDIPVNTRFLLLAQALEAYHSRSDRFVAEIEPPDAFRARRDALLGFVAHNAERAWLREKLNFANQKTLATRLDELIADQQAHVNHFIANTVLFANTIRWTRNYYTHYGQDEEDRIDRGVGRIAQGLDIARYTFQMRALLELLFIRDLNLPAGAVNRVVYWANQMQVIGV